MKKCSKCKIEKDEENFSWRNKAKGLRCSYCKPCFSDYDRTRWENPDRKLSKAAQTKNFEDRNRRFIWAYLKDHPCVTCNEDDPVVLEFDHRDSASKTANISDMILRRSIAVLQTEIDKCDVLCANCHRRRTAIQQNWFHLD